MRRLLGSLTGLASAAVPTLALATDVGGGYRGIASMYYTLIAIVLVYGVYDTFGKSVGTHIGAGVIVVGCYALTQLAPG